MDKLSTNSEHLEEHLEDDASWDGQERRKYFRRAKDLEMELLEAHIKEMLANTTKAPPDISAFKISFKEMLSILAFVVTLGGMWLSISTQVAELNVKVNERQLSVNKELTQVTQGLANLQVALDRFEDKFNDHSNSEK